ncbi:MAG: YihY/virulence factor BrkB family protein [Chromatiales bacterium]|nr:YihY/virulence factor BrkB family protein [Chromatiales bacterium]
MHALPRDPAACRSQPTVQRLAAAWQTSPALFSTLRRQFEHWLFDVPEEIGGRALRWVTLPLGYLYALLRDLGRGELGLRAMSLVYSTLFAIVPVIAVAFAVLKAFGYHRELEPVLFEFLRPLGEQGYDAHREHHGLRRERAGHDPRHGGLRVPALHRGRR